MSILTEPTAPPLFGFGLFQLMVDDWGKAVDYLFLNISAGFQQMIGLHRDDIIGKKASEVFSGKKREFNWLEYIHTALIANEIYETTRFIEVLDRECNVIVVPSIDRCFTLILRDTREDLKVNSFNNTTVTMLLAALREQCEEAEEHVSRLHTNCQLLGQHFQLTPEELDDLALLALLHDIGKIGINPAILKKPATLTSKDWIEMRRHSEIGWRIAKGFANIGAVAKDILFHHERWDGNGYPAGLKADDIPLPCRILAVTDAYDAMTSDRVYRKSLKKEVAVEELVKNAGLQFDPQVVRYFIDILS